MLDHVFSINFAVESEAYQALTELKKAPVTAGYVLSQAAIVKREGGVISVKDSFDFGTETHDDRVIGGIIGSLTGVLGGPIGMLFYGSLGALIGSTVDAKDFAENASILEKVSQSIGEGQTALLIMASEEHSGALVERLAKFDTVTEKYDAAEVENEIEEAAKLQKQMEKDARKQLRKEKTDEQKAKIAAKREEIRARFDGIKAKLGK
ncbi:MAG: DUF1269 domain-containing protein [Ruminococcus sp.]|nr:DUF1269 domain-containing protein [Ruminococcus sp.]